MIPEFSGDDNLSVYIFELLSEPDVMHVSWNPPHVRISKTIFDVRKGFIMERNESNTHIAVWKSNVSSADS